MEKLTDNEIIKALDYCCGNIAWEYDAECTQQVCYQCALPENRDGDTRWCRQWLIKDALDLINRQKAEIERLQKTVVDLNANLSESVNCFTRMESLYKIKCKELEVAKTEAIKEFAESLKTEYADFDEMHEEIQYNNSICAIENLVKEMTE